MSLATWKAEFYPVDASQFEAEDAAAHSLRKWEGLRAEALARHGITNGHLELEIRDGAEDTFLIDYRTCSLCAQFSNEDDGCNKCPLYFARGKHACTARRFEESYSPWSEWVRSGDPEPMIHWLKVTVEQQGGSHVHV